MTSKQPPESNYPLPERWPIITGAVTGMLGSGKSTFSQLLNTMGVPVVDCDQIASRLTSPGEPGLDKIIDSFGNGVILSDGSLDRRALLNAILEDESARKRLEDLLHPLIFQEMDKRLKHLASKGADIAIVEVPLLFEAGWHEYFDVVCMVSAPMDICIGRIVMRNQVDRKIAEKWLALQMPKEMKEEMSDLVVTNSGDLAHLAKEAKAFYQKLVELRREKNC